MQSSVGVYSTVARHDIAVKGREAQAVETANRLFGEVGQGARLSAGAHLNSCREVSAVGRWLTLS